MKALVLGAGGQVGRALVKTAPATVSVTALERRQCDIVDAPAVRRALVSAAPDIVLNAAAYTAVDRAENDSTTAQLVNGVAPGVVAAAARDAGARFVHVSTDFVFDGGSSRPYRPDDAPYPLSVYGRTKLEGERAVAAVDSSSLIVRTAWVYAAHSSCFLTTMLRLMRERDQLSVVADQIGTPTYATSLARAIWAMAKAGAAGIYHYTDSGVASWYDFAVAIEEEARAAGLLGKSIPVAPIMTSDYPTAARRPAFSVLDKSATWKLIGAPAPHWRAGLRTALKEQSANG